MAYLKINKKYVSFTGLVSVGEKALFIYLDKFGHETDTKELLKTCLSFNVVVFKGFECDPFEVDKKEFCLFLRKLHEKNNKLKIIIYCDGNIKPIGLNAIDITYIVNTKLNEKKETASLNYYLESESLFYSTVDTIEEIDDVSLICIDNAIPKHRMYISFTKPELTDDILDVCKLNGFNFGPNLKEMFWPKLGV